MGLFESCLRDEGPPQLDLSSTSYLDLKFMYFTKQQLLNLVYSTEQAFLAG